MPLRTNVLGTYHKKCYVRQTVTSHGGTIPWILYSCSGKGWASCDEVDCIVYQESYCGKISNSALNDVMPTVMKIANFLIAPSATTHRQFQSLLEEMESTYRDVIPRCAPIMKTQMGQSPYDSVEIRKNLVSPNRGAGSLSRLITP